MRLTQWGGDNRPWDNRIPHRTESEEELKCPFCVEIIKAEVKGRRCYGRELLTEITKALMKLDEWLRKLGNRFGLNLAYKESSIPAWQICFPQGCGGFSLSRSGRIYWL